MVSPRCRGLKELGPLAVQQDDALKVTMVSPRCRGLKVKEGAPPRHEWFDRDNGFPAM